MNRRVFVMKQKIHKVKTPTKCHNHKAQLSGDTKSRGDEEQTKEMYENPNTQIENQKRGADLER